MASDPSPRSPVSISVALSWQLGLVTKQFSITVVQETPAFRVTNSGRVERTCDLAGQTHAFKTQHRSCYVN